MSATPDSTLANPEQLIADLQRRLAEREAELAESKAERDEALQRETASTEVLQVINSSPGDLAPVFDAMLGRALQLCEAAFGLLNTWDGERWHHAAWKGLSAELLEAIRWGEPFVSSPGSVADRLVRGEDIISSADLVRDEAVRNVPYVQTMVRVGGFRSYIAIALRKDAKLLGAIAIYRQEVRPFTDKQISLLQNFAAQAVIAMQNARLLTETREALEQQTATAEVLQVINSSPGDLAPVFDAMLERATRLCEAPHGILRIWDGERFQFGAAHGEPGFSDWVRRRSPVGIDSDASPLGRIVAGERVLHFADATDDSAYSTSPGFSAMVETSGMRSAVTVALHKDDALLGTITIYRLEVKPFTEKQIALLQNFAAQAVIAMENARLLTETREALEQQTATAEVLQVINASPGDLQPVFDAILEKATRVCEAGFGTLLTWDGERFHWVAFRGLPTELVEALQQVTLAAGEGRPVASRIVRGEMVISMPDLREEEHRDVPVAQAFLRHGARSCVTVALRKEERLLGLMTIYREEVRPFTEKKIALLRNFAAQAVIAMENARLLTETREALEQQTATAEILQIINSSPGNLAPVFDAILEKAHSLCGATHGSLHLYDGDKVRAVAIRGQLQAVAERLREPRRMDANHPVRQLVAGESIVHVPDLAEIDAPSAQNVVEIAALRTVLYVALRNENTLLGLIGIGRDEVRPFTDKQIALLQNFAAQAVIAMENARLITETREALEQQTATAELLGVINSSPGDLAPVWDAMLEKATRLCEAASGILWTYDGSRFRAVAVHGATEEYDGWLHSLPDPVPSPSLARIASGEKIVRDDDLATAPGTLAYAHTLAGMRTGFLVALRKGDALLGAIRIFKQDPHPFSDKHIALVENFAAQAVIAMENTRLITETREALEQQTATAEVLQVINSSPGDLTPVFDAMLERALRLCTSTFGVLFTWDGERFHRVAWRGGSDEAIEAWSGAVIPPPGSPGYRLVQGANSVSIADLAADEIARTTPVQYLLRFGARSYVTAALRKEGRLLGMLTVYRQEVRPFTDKEIALLQNFAAQAVIAMENARLINETREALEQQTATAEVLQVINSSPGQLMPVFDAMLDKAVRLCEADFGIMLTVDGEASRIVAEREVPEPLSAFLSQHLPDIGPDTFFGRAVIGRAVLHTADMREEPAYHNGQPLTLAAVDNAGVRALLMAPLLKDDGVLGVFAIFRRKPRPFSDKQIALLQNFAAQAVIAMENARLITETREALDQQTATAEVLGVINASPGELKPVFDAMLEKAMSLCEAASGVLMTYDGDHLHAASWRGVPAAFYDYLRQPVRPAPGNSVYRLLQGEEVVHIADLREDADNWRGDAARRAMIDLGGARTLVIVPLRKDGKLVGTIRVYRQEVRPFTDKQIALLQNFAAQAVIAMENARLLGELRQRTEEVSELNRSLEARVTEQVDELGRVGRLKRFLAPQLAELIVSQGDEKILESHRREIVVVFCDLRGYTAFTETAEPEEVLEFLREYHGALGPLVSQFEGTLDQFSGDGIMVFFNDPVPIPDPAERAVRMAVAMREAAGALIAIWRRRDRQLGFGAGIAQGYATLGQIGFAERSGYTAIGTVCNLAARLCAEAKDGQILISGRVAAAVEKAVPLEDLGSLALKGLNQPVSAFNVPLAPGQPAFRVIEGGPLSV